MEKVNKSFRTWLLNETESGDFAAELAQFSLQLNWRDEEVLSEARFAALLVLREEIVKRNLLTMKYVYFIRAGQNGPIKIGFSHNVEARLASLQTAHHERLVVISKHRGSEDYERELHARFTHLRLEGEWFQPTPELLAVAHQGTLQ